MPGDYNILATLKKALDDLAAKDLDVMVQNSGSEIVPDRSCIKLRFINQNYFIHYPSFEINSENGPEINPVVKVLLLHYMAQASGMPIGNKWISYKELPGGHIYYGPFTQRAVNPFIRLFKGCPEEFRFAAEKLGGIKGQGGDISMIIPVFPKIPINYVLWLGSDEFPASATILFDASAASYLPTEDYAVICGVLLKELNKQRQNYRC